MPQINKLNVMLVYLFDDIPFKVCQSIFGMKLANQNLINTLLTGHTTMPYSPLITMTLTICEFMYEYWTFPTTKCTLDSKTT